MEDRLKALELLVLNQQTRIQFLENQNALFNKDINTFLNEQITLAQGQRGTRGTDMITIMKFVTATLATTVTKLQQSVTDTLDSYIQNNHESIISLPLQSQPLHPQNMHELEEIKERMKILEKQIVVEITKLQNTKPSEFSPLTKLQNTVDQIIRDVNGLKKIDSKAFLDLTLSTVSSNLRKEFIEQTSLRATKESVVRCSDDIKRLEGLVMALQTFLYKSSQPPIAIDTTEVQSFFKAYEESSKETFYAWFEEQKQNMDEYTKRKDKEVQHSMNVSIQTIEKVNRNLPESVLDSYVSKFTVLRNELYSTVQFNEKLNSEIIIEINNKLTSEARQLSELQLSQVRLQKYVEDNPIRIIQQPTQEQPIQQQLHKPIQQGLKSKSKSNNTTSIYTTLTKCFYTALFGPKTDTFGDFVPIPGWDYICFTDLDIESKVWKCIKVDRAFENPVLDAKYVKWMSHEFVEDYDLVIWLDAYISPNPLQEKLFESWITDMYNNNIQIGHRHHGERNCIWDECDAVIKTKRDTRERVDLVRTRLKKASMPKGWGLFDTNIVIKFHKHSQVKELGQKIFSILENDSYRDQLAIPQVYYTTKYTSYKEYSLLEACLKTGIHVRIPPD